MLIDDGVYVFVLLKLRSYSTEVHQICNTCSQIIADEPVEIGMAIFHSKAMNEGESADFAHF